MTSSKPPQKYIGNFKEGQFDGLGVLFLDVAAGSLIIGPWKDGELEGVSLMVTEREHIAFGPSSGGAMNGDCKEFEMEVLDFEFNRFLTDTVQRVMDSRFEEKPDVSMEDVLGMFLNRFSLRLSFEGNYVDDVRNGKGTLYLEDGGRIEAVWKNGDINDEKAKYVYPDYPRNGKECYLTGKWVDGEMVSALFMATGEDDDRTSYCYDEATSDSLGRFPIKRERLETMKVYVSQSLLPNGGNGLFAKKPLLKDEVVAFYNGLHVQHDTINARDWALNANALTVNDEFCVDIPPEMSSEDKYCASLGHFANHDWKRQNCEYRPYWSPRFGDIKCLRAIKDIAENEEILVDYDYTDEFPDWYRIFASAQN